MRIRPAGLEDADALGEVMVASWLAAHRGQVPDDAWRKRVAEWTPEVSARGWRQTLADQADGRGVLLVAEDDADVLGLVYAMAPEDASAGEIAVLYVAPGRQREGVGEALLRAGAAMLHRLGSRSVHVSVLTANVPARRFYEAMGGLEAGHGTTDEDGELLATTIYEWADVTDLLNR
jgi:ribosomal protein S18 acetylase RimI-like enzyme